MSINSKYFILNKKAIISSYLLHIKDKITPLFLSIQLIILIGICPLYLHASNLDSLKSELNHAVKDSIKCSLTHSIFKQYEKLNIVDSIYVYAEKAMECCPLEKEEGMANVTEIIYKLFKEKQSEFVDSLIQSNSQKLGKNVDKLLYYTKISERAYLTGNDKQFHYYLDKAKDCLYSSDQNLSKAYYYNLFGYYNMNKGNNLTAIQSYEVSLSFTDTLSKKYLSYRLDLGIAYNKIGGYEKAVDLFTSNIKIANEKNYDRIKLFSYYGLIFSYLEMERYDKSIQLCHEVLNHNKNENSAELGYLYFALGNGHLNSSKRDSAIYYFRKGLEFSKEKNDSQGIHDNYRGIADYYSKTKKFDLAEKFYKKAMEVTNYIPDPELNQDLAKTYFELKDFKNAYLYSNQFEETSNKNKSESQSDLRLAAQLIEDANRYKQQTTRKINQQKKDQQRLYKMLIAAVFLILFISSLLYFLQKNKKTLDRLNLTISDRNKELKNAINKQNESIKYLENFAAVAAHDLKAPIRTASSFANLLVKTSSDKFTERELTSLNFISSRVSQLSTMIDDLLNLSKLGTNLPQEEPVDLNIIVKNVKSLLTKKIEESNTQVIIKKDLPSVIGHQSLLIQLFQNLIKNSIDHNKTPNNTIVEIDYEIQSKDSILIKVSDNSGGIPDYLKPTLFDLFSSSDKNSGNGIGLAICKKIVTHYGGNIWVTANESEGSTFHFTLASYGGDLLNKLNND